MRGFRGQAQSPRPGPDLPAGADQHRAAHAAGRAGGQRLCLLCLAQGRHRCRPPGRRRRGVDAAAHPLSRAHPGRGGLWHSRRGRGTSDRQSRRCGSHRHEDHPADRGPAARKSRPGGLGIPARDPPGAGRIITGSGSSRRTAEAAAPNRSKTQMSWLEKLLPPKIQPTDPAERRQVPEGLWVKCPSCESVLYKTDLEQNQNVCPTCSHHHRIGARARLNGFLDAEGRYEIGQEVLPVDALKFKDSRKYPERLKEALENTGETDALVVMGGAVLSISLVAAAFEFDFMGGSMGSVVGERFVRGVESAVEQKVPFVCFTATGGARMQEGLLSLMQMAKTNAALTRLAKKDLPYVSVLTDPTMGGVSAGFAFVGDIVIAEPKALIGFAGPRVIESTVRVTLPEGFQRAEFLQQKGGVDFICDRRE